MITIREVKNFWESHINNEIYLEKHARRGSEEYFKVIQKKRKKFVYYFPKLMKFAGEKGRLLDLGCGMGMDTLQYAHRGFEVVGMDLTASAIELAQKYFQLKGKKGFFVIGNAELLPFKDSSFDVVHSLGVLHHTPSYEKAVAEIYRVLCPKGRVIVMLYNKFSLNNIIHQILRYPYEAPRNRKDKCPVVYRFSRKQVRQLFYRFSEVRISVEYLFGAGWGHLYTLMPRPLYSFLSKYIGWHLVVLAKKKS